MADRLGALVGSVGGRGGLGGQWLHFDSCVSTNDEALRLGRAGAAAGLVVTCGEQSGGRGRLGRRWHSPPGENLYLSLLLRPPLPPARAPLLCLCAGLALHAAAEAALADARGAITSDGGSGRLQLKWPNDLLWVVPPTASAPGRVAKLGGILTEMVCAGGAIDFVVIGLGCNVNTSAFPPELAATSLRQVSGLSSPLDLHQLAQRLLGELDDGYRRYLELGPSPLLCAFAEAARLGDAHPEVTVTTPQKTLRGVPIGLGSEGELLLRIPSGQIERVLSGDVAMSVAVQ